MSLDCASVVQPIISFVFDTVKDYVSYIRSYDDNMSTLKEKLSDLCSKKQDIDTKVRIGNDKLEKITKEAANWLQSVRKLSQNEELKVFVLRKQMIAEEVLKLLDERDLKKLLTFDNEMQEVVLRVVKEHNEEDFEMVTRVVSKVMKDTMEEFRRVIKEDMKVAMVMMTIVKDEDLEKLSKGDLEMVEILEKAREMCENKSWEISDNEDIEHIRKLPRPVEKLVQNANFLKALPENVKFGVELLDGLWKGSIGLKEEIIAASEWRNDDGRLCCYYFVVPFEHFHKRYEMSKAAELMASEIQSIVDRTPTDPVTLPGRAQDLDEIPSGFLKGLKSREDLVQQILKKLRNNQVNAVGVYGMGGSGKTTLAKEIIAKSNFDTKIMVEISETPIIEHIQDHIAETLDLPLHDVRSLSQRAKLLYNRLKQLKEQKQDKEQKNDTKVEVLIILDNMWNKLDLDEVGIPYESTNDFCFKFLVTSREKNVCQMMDIKDDNIFQLGLLNDKESEELFYHHVGMEKLLQGDYKSIGQRLLSKCGGLSLTIMTTANALKGKDLPMWKHFANELEKPISSQLSGMHRETYAILEASYKVVESAEKRMFFLLFCLSPLGSSISIETFMRYAIGLDLFQHVNKLSEVLEQVETWVTELVSSSLLMKGDSQLRVKIHDDVRASAISFAAKDKLKFLVEAIPRWMCKETFNKYTAISLLSGGHHFSRLSGVKAEMLHILLLKGNNSDSSELAGGFFQRMPNLKVLHLSYMNLKPVLPQSMSELKSLKTLQLEHCNLGKLSVMCELIELLVVSLRDSILEELPDDMGKLVNIRILDMRGCKVSSIENCSVIASLTSLEGLYLFHDFKKWAMTTTESQDSGGTSKSIAEFHELPYLNLLEVQVGKLMHLPLGHFAEKLDNFNIHVGENSNLISGINKTLHRRVLEIGSITFDNHAVKDNSCLKSLLKRADYLSLDEIKANNIVPELGVNDFKELKFLKLYKCSGLECVISIDELNDLTTFRNLKYLELENMDDLKLICKGDAQPGMFSDLRHLKLITLSNLEYALPIALLPRKLTKVKIEGCDSLRVIFKEKDFVSSESEKPGDDIKMDDDIVNLPRLKSMDIDGERALTSFFGSAAELSNASSDQQEGQTFFNRQMMCPSLELLKLSYCQFDYLWCDDFDMSSFQNLNEISIFVCDNLRSLGSASVFYALVQLETLDISGCYEMENVIFEDAKELENHSNTIRLQQSGEIPKLKKLSLEDLDNFTAFVESEDPTLFNDKIICPSLEQLEVCRCRYIEYLWSKDPAMFSFPNLKEIYIETCSNLQSLGSASVFFGLVQLETLVISDINYFQEVIIGDTTEFQQLREIPKLKKLNLDDLPSLSAFVKSEDPTLFNDKIICPSLELLQSYCCRIEYLWNKELHMSSFPNLNKIEIEYCRNLRSLGPASAFSALVQLQSLSIKDCQSMKDVITKEAEELEICNKTIEFRQLRELYLQDLGNLESFCGDSYIVEFPKLKKLYMHKMSKLVAFVGSEDSTTLFSDKVKFPSLEELDVIGVSNDTITELWNTHPSTANDEQKGGGNDISVDFPKLKSLNLVRLSIRSFSSKQDATLHFQSLVTIEIQNCSSLEVFWSGILVAPKLKEVKVHDCSKLQRFLSGDPSRTVELLSLQQVDISNAENMESFTVGPSKTPNLRQVELVNCKPEMENLKLMIQTQN